MYFILYKLINLLFDAAELILLLRVVISWLPVNSDNRFVILLYQITEPVLAPVRSAIRRTAAGQNMFLDFSPVVVFILLAVLKRIIFWIIF